MGKKDEPKTPKRDELKTPKKSSSKPETPVKEDEPVIIAGSLSPIAEPLADTKLEKKVLKVTKRAAKEKQVKRGVKEVVKHIRKFASQGTTLKESIVLLAGDVSPMDVISHLPVLCEEASIPFIFVKSKMELGMSAGTKRATCCLLITPPAKGADAESKEQYEEVYEKVKNLSAAN